MTILVTGATSGIGLASATLLAEQGHAVALVGRTDASVEHAAISVRTASSVGADVSCYAADLAYRGEVTALADAVRADHPKLDGLVLCAAVNNPEPGVTEGIDTTLAVNHLAPAMLTRLLDGSLAGGRILLVASSQHATAGPFDPATFRIDGSATSMRRYEMTKLLNVLFASARANRPHDSPLEAIDPGFVHTNLGRNAPRAFRVMLTLTRPFQAPPHVPAGVIVDRLTAADFQDGAYMGRNGHARRAVNAQDAAAAANAWEWTNALLD